MTGAGSRTRWLQLYRATLYTKYIDANVWTALWQWVIVIIRRIRRASRREDRPARHTLHWMCRLLLVAVFTGNWVDTFRRVGHRVVSGRRAAMSTDACRRRRTSAARRGVRHQQQSVQSAAASTRSALQAQTRPHEPPRLRYLPTTPPPLNTTSL